MQVFANAGRSALRLFASGAAGAVLTTVAAAAPLPTYPTPGVENPIVYNFIAPVTGTLFGYFAGSDAGLVSTLGLIAGGVTTTNVFQSDVTPVGTPYNFGSVTAGESLVFFINNATGTFYSDVSRNADHFNHVYSSFFAGNADVPAGTYVGFEDLSGGGDADYNDLNFVFNEQVGTGTVPISPSPVPLPATAPLLGAGLVGLGLARYGLRRTKPAATV